MLYVFLYFFLPVSKKGDTGFAKSQNENDMYVICYYYVSFVLLLFRDSGSAGQMHS